MKTQIRLLQGAVWSGSTLFAIPSAPFGLITLWWDHIVQILEWLQQIFWVSEYLGNLWYMAKANTVWLVRHFVVHASFCQKLLHLSLIPRNYVRFKFSRYIYNEISSPVHRFLRKGFHGNPVVYKFPSNRTICASISPNTISTPNLSCLGQNINAQVLNANSCRDYSSIVVNLTDELKIPFIWPDFYCQWYQTRVCNIGLELSCILLRSHDHKTLNNYVLCIRRENDKTWMK